MIYKTLVLTGLRRNELASLTVASLVLDAPVPHLVLDARDEKNRQGAEIPLRADLAADLAQWTDETLQRARAAARASGEAVPARLPADAPLFYVPKALVKILDRDLKLAGIAKKDNRGRSVDIHALRHSFASHLSKGGVAPRTAQAALRHSDINLTMVTYTDPALLDVAGALDALPSLSLGEEASDRARAGTGTDGKTEASGPLAPTLAPNWHKRGQSLSTPDKAESFNASARKRRASPPSRKKLAAAAIGSPREGEREWSGREDLNLRPPAPEAGALPSCATPRLHVGRRRIPGPLRSRTNCNPPTNPNK